MTIESACVKIIRLKLHQNVRLWIFPSSPVFENCGVDIALIKKYDMDNQYKSRFCCLLEFHFDSLKNSQGVNLTPKFNLSRTLIVI